jgi:ankyrin repeat protein
MASSQFKKEIHAEASSSSHASPTTGESKENQTEPFFFGQDKIIQLNKKLGFNSNKNGVCWGMSWSAKNAILVEDIVTFNNRIIIIYATELPVLLVEINLAETKKREEYFKSVKSHSVEIKEEKVSARLENTLTVREELLASIPIFSSNVEINQSRCEFSDIFPSEFILVQKSIDWLTPVALDSQGGEVLIDEIPGFYSLETLTECLRALRAEFLTEPSILHPVAIMLSHNYHSTTLGFIPKDKNKWWLFNPSMPPGYSEGDELSVAKAIYRFLIFGSRICLYSKSKREPVLNLGFSKFYSQNISFRMQIYCSQKQSSLVADKIRRWRLRPLWREMILSPLSKIHALDFPWLCHIAKTKEILMAKELLARGVLVNQPTKQRHMSALNFAVDHENLPMATLLLKYKADANHQGKIKETPLFDAIRNRNLLMVNILLQHNANPNQQSLAKVTPLVLAVHHKTSIIVQRLLVAGSDVNLDKRLLTIAAANKDYDTVKILLDHKADPDASISSLHPPLHTVIANQQIDIAILLLAYGANINLQSKYVLKDLPKALLKWGNNNNSYSEMESLLTRTRTTLFGRKNYLLEEIVNVTALHLAVFTSYLSGCRLLLENGANPSLVASGITAMDIIKLMYPGSLEELEAITPLHDDYPSQKFLYEAKKELDKKLSSSPNLSFSVLSYLGKTGYQFFQHKLATHCTLLHSPPTATI